METAAVYPANPDVTEPRGRSVTTIFPLVMGFIPEPDILETKETFHPPEVYGFHSDTFIVILILLLDAIVHLTKKSAEA